MKKSVLFLVPLEIYTLIIPGFLVLIYSIFKYKEGVLIDQTDLNVGRMIVYAALAVFFVFVLKALVCRYPKEELSDRFLSTAYLISVLVASSLLISYSLIILITSVDPQNVIESTNFVSGVDDFLFVENPIFKLHSLQFPFKDVFDILIYLAYQNMVVVFPLTLMLLMYSNRKLIRKFLIVSLLLPMIGFVFWVSIPATSPEGFYVKNIFNLEHGQSIKDEVSNLDRGNIESGISIINSVWISPENSYYNVSSLPSMHAAWGLAILFYALKFRKKLAWFYIPWFILNTIGTFYLFQHFIIDTIAGLILSVIVICAINKLVNWYENKESEDLKKALFKNI